MPDIQTGSYNSPANPNTGPGGFYPPSDSRGFPHPASGSTSDSHHRTAYLHAGDFGGYPYA